MIIICCSLCIIKSKGLQEFLLMQQSCCWRKHTRVSIQPLWIRRLTYNDIMKLIVSCGWWNRELCCWRAHHFPCWRPYTYWQHWCWRQNGYGWCALSDEGKGYDVLLRCRAVVCSIFVYVFILLNDCTLWIQHSAVLSAIFICSRFDVISVRALLKHIFLYLFCDIVAVIDEHCVPLFTASRLYVRFIF